MTIAATSIFDAFVYEPTECQSKALCMIDAFLTKQTDCKAFVLRGSAGTGKTSLMQAVVTYLNSLGTNFVLLAPTARAAKILAKRTDESASTIHSRIYFAEELADGKVKFTYRPNDCDVRTIFMVDEASMLAAELDKQEDFITPNPLLSDLIRHIKEGNANNQVIFIGDTYQLPPVFEAESVALSDRLLHEKFGISAKQTTLNQVMRQTENSPVLGLANEIKARKDSQKYLKYLSLTRLSSEQSAISNFVQYFDRKNLQNVIFIANSNKKVQDMNHQIRRALGLNTKILMKGDAVMVHQNWIGKSENISKGDMGIVVEVSLAIEEIKNLKFFDAVIDFEGKMIRTKVLIDCLLSEKGEVNKEAIKALKGDRMAKNSSYRSNQKASGDPYMSAMYLRYGYAVTCHKAQGGEWKRVLIDPKFHLENHRWLYTAVTRASESVMSWWY